MLTFSAGVIGLSTALLLAQKGYKITIVAEYLPGDLSIEYTSPWAVSIPPHNSTDPRRRNG
jgi:D-amino-acid oxidase